MATILEPVSTAFIVIAKKAYQPLRDDNDQLLISNMGAIRLGLEALLKEDASDYDRAGQLWAQAARLLATEEENLVGAGAQGTVQFADDFEMGLVGGEMDRGYWSWGWNGWP